MVKQQQKKDKDGGSIELGAVATPVVLYGLRSLLTPNKKEKKETAGGKRQQRKQQDGGEGLADLGKLVQKSMEGTVTGSLLDAVPIQGGKRHRARKQRGGEGEAVPEMPNPSVEVPEMSMDGGKRRKQRKQRGGEDMPVEAPEEPVMDGGKRRKQRKQRGGEDMPVEAPEEPVMNGGKRRKQRKQRGGEYAPVDDLKADIGIPKQAGGKKDQKDQKKYWAKKGGALDQYAKQLESISNQLSKLMQ